MKTMKISNTIEIKNTAAKVFYWLEDPSRAAEWMTSVTRTEIIQKTPNWIGTTFRETVVEDGRGTEMHGVVTDFQANRRLAFHLEGEFNTVEVTYTLEEKDQNTELSQAAVVRFKGLLGILSVLFAPALKKKIIAQAEREFAKLKELCERGV